MLKLVNLQEQTIEVNNLISAVLGQGDNTAQYFLNKECIKEKDVKGR